MSAEQRIEVQSTVEVLAIKSPGNLQKNGRVRVSLFQGERKSALENLIQSDTDSLSKEKELHKDQTIQVVRKEEQMYFSESQIPKQEDPLGWWKESEGCFPDLPKLARFFLCIPATSTPAEQIFSAAGSTCSQKRASLSCEHVDMLTFLHFNSVLIWEKEMSRNRTLANGALNAATLFNGDLFTFKHIFFLSVMQLIYYLYMYLFASI